MVSMAYRGYYKSMMLLVVLFEDIGEMQKLM